MIYDDGKRVTLHHGSRVQKGIGVSIEACYANTVRTMSAKSGKELRGNEMQPKTQASLQGI